MLISKHKDSGLFLDRQIKMICEPLYFSLMDAMMSL